jgi:hypothetical protein
VNRRDHEQTTPPEPLSGLQGEGGSGRRQGRPHLAQLAEHFEVHPNQITAWKSQLEASASEIFGPGGGTPATPAVDVKSLHAKIGELGIPVAMGAATRRIPHPGARSVRDGNPCGDRQRDTLFVSSTSMVSDFLGVGKLLAPGFRVSPTKFIMSENWDPARMIRPNL